MIEVRIAPSTGNPTLADELAAFLDRKKPTGAHVHACPECYQDAPCGLDCATAGTTTEEDQRRGIRRGDCCVCALCLRAGGLPEGLFCTSIADHLVAARAAVPMAGADPVPPPCEGGEERG